MHSEIYHQIFRWISVICIEHISLRIILGNVRGQLGSSRWGGGGRGERGGDLTLNHLTNILCFSHRNHNFCSHSQVTMSVLGQISSVTAYVLKAVFLVFIHLFKSIYQLSRREHPPHHIMSYPSCLSCISRERSSHYTDPSGENMHPKSQYLL